jgi:hypothetical protein
MLLRLAYLGVANVFALLRLLPVSSQAKDAEILALRHQLHVLQRQLGPGRVRFTSADRALLAALLHRLPKHVLHGELLVLGVKVAASTVWEILHEAGIDPVPERGSATWAGFLLSRLRPFWLATTSRRSPCPGRGSTCSL